jgi:rubrerythrin
VFNIKKTQHIAEIKNMYESLTRSAEEMELENLDNLLEAQGLLTNVKKYICSNCPRTFKTQKGLDTHERLCVENVPNVKKKKIWKCPLCDCTKPTLKGIKSHCKNKHGIDTSDSQTINDDSNSETSERSE